jgi:hypothetical protein
MDAAGSTSNLETGVLVAASTLSNPWAVSTIVLVVLFLLKEVLKKWTLEAAGYLQRRAYNRWAGRRLLRRAALRQYQARLLERHAKVPVPFEIDRDLRMDDVYVPLRTAHAGGREEDVDAAAALLATRRAMVIGSPGSGKSMLLRHLALRLVRTHPSVLWRQLPVLLELHRLNDPGTGLEDQLVRQLDRDGFPHAERFLLRALDAGQVVVLLDGLDEVGSGERRRVVQEIRDFLTRYDRCRVVVTCRTAVYRGELRDHADRTFEVQELSAHLIRRFLHNWPGMPGTGTIEQLMRALQEAPRIMALARNPLLLTIIAYLYTEVYESSARRLPHSRLEFYNDATNVLLRRWHGERNRYAAPEKRAVLQHLALFNQDRPAAGDDRLTVEYRVVLAEIGKVLPTLNRQPDEAAAILDEIVERSGLLLAVDGGERYQFAHLTLQEYFAARELEGDPAGLLDRFQADPTLWREPLLLWCSGDHDSSELIGNLHELAPMMALECLAVAQRVDDKVADAILDWARSHLEVADDTEAVARAFGLVASDERPRGRAVFAFLEGLLEGSATRRRRVAADALAATNLPRAATALASAHLNARVGELLHPYSTPEGYRPDDLREALVRMGDLAVPALAERAATGSEDVLDDLRRIATPAAAEALVALLWRGDDTSVRAAWRLGVLLREPVIDEALDRLVISSEQRALHRIDWLWRPFGDPTSSLGVIAGRLGELLQRERPDLAPASSPPIDPRVGVPLLAVARSGGFKVKSGSVEIDERMRGILRSLGDRLESFDPTGTGLSRSSLAPLPRGPKVPLYELVPYLRSDTDQARPGIELQLALVDHLVPQIFGSGQARRLVAHLPEAIRIDLVSRLPARLAHQDHWANVLRPIRYMFASSWHYRVVLVIAAGLSGLALWELWQQVHAPHVGWSRWLPWWEMAVIVLSWVLIIAQRCKPVVLGGVAAAPGLGIMIAWFSFLDRALLFSLGVILALPLTIGSASVGYRSTMLLRHQTGSWLLTAGILAAVASVVAACTWVGLRRDRLARNPLHDVLDHPAPGALSG